MIGCSIVACLGLAQLVSWGIAYFKSMGLEKTMRMYSVSGTIEAIAPADLKGAAEGVYIVENFPRMLKYKDDGFHRRRQQAARHG